MNLGYRKIRKISRPKAEIVNLDTADSNVDIRNLNEFDDEEFDEVYAFYVLEHLEFEAFFLLMDEIHRILGPNGIFSIKVPHWRGTSAFICPEHRRCFSAYTFNYFAKFTVIERKFRIVKSGKLNFLNVFNFLYNIHPVITEKFLSNILAPEEIIFKLRKAKR